jgi:hypothetical protein
LLGFNPNVATRELDKSPKEGTGEPHLITPVLEIELLSSRLISVVSVVYIGFLKAGLKDVRPII